MRNTGRRVRARKRRAAVRKAVAKKGLCKYERMLEQDAMFEYIEEYQRERAVEA